MAFSRPVPTQVTNGKHLPCKVKMNTDQLMIWSIEDPDGEFRVTHIVRNGRMEIMAWL